MVDLGVVDLVTSGLLQRMEAFSQLGERLVDLNSLFGLQGPMYACGRNRNLRVHQQRLP